MVGRQFQWAFSIFFWWVFFVFLKFSHNTKIFDICDFQIYCTNFHMLLALYVLLIFVFLTESWDISMPLWYIFFKTIHGFCISDHCSFFWKVVFVTSFQTSDVLIFKSWFYSQSLSLRNHDWSSIWNFKIKLTKFNYKLKFLSFFVIHTNIHIS